MSPRAASRRTTLLGALAVVPLSTALLAACDEADTDDPTATPEVDPDVALADQVRAEIAEAYGLVAAASRSDRRLREPLSQLLAMHAAHLESVGGDEAATVAPPAGALPAVRSRVVTRERLHQNRLADASLRAESGALARLLAVMSAGVAAHLAALDPSGPA